MINTFIELVVGKKQITEKRNFLWNMLGSGIYSFISMFLSIFVIRVMGEKMGGVFSIAVTISQMMLYIAYFELRTYQVTDVDRKYRFSQYHGAKLLTCLLMMIVSVIYILLQTYDVQKALIVFLMCIYRMIDGYADLYEGEFQLNGKLYLAGKSMAFRSILSSLCFIVIVFLTKNMILSLCITIVVALVALVAFDLLIAGSFESIKPSLDFKGIRNILVECFPLFVGAFLWVYILSASRIAIDSNMTDEYQAYYQTLFMPVSIINLFATFFFRPALTTLAKYYSKKEGQAFRKQIKELSLTIMVFTIICMIGAFFLGIPVLMIMSGCDLSDYRNVLVFLMAAGGMNSLSFFLYYVLTTMRKSKSVLFGYISAALLALGLSSPLVRKLEIWGAAISFFITVMYLCTIFGIMIIIHYKRELYEKSV